MIFRAFSQQRDFLLCQKRVIGAFAGKRGGKTEVGAVRGIVHSENLVGFRPNGIDPYLGIIIAPTGDMLRRLSMKKFLAYAKPFGHNEHKTHSEVTWHNGALIQGISADKPQRLEGAKANWIWIDEVFQCPKEVFLEARARVADTQGTLWCTGSLGVQYRNPKLHWAYREFKENPGENTACFEWSTADNPFFPKDEIISLKNELDPVTFRQMFTITWDIPGTGLVYGDISQANFIKGYRYNPQLETYIAIDWGWAHPMACLFFQYDRRNDTVYLFDEIVASGMKLEVLWDRIMAKRQEYGGDLFRVKEWICDIAGNQEREQTGLSNVAWFAEKPRNIHFKYTSSLINYGIALVRTYVKTGLGQVKFFIDEVRCPKSVDGLKTYSYPEKNGIIISETPVKKDDDCVDGIRYFFVNILDKKLGETFNQFSRWKL
jgi:hypothetical protein